MLFNSLTFVIFFALLLTLHYTVNSWMVRKSILLIGSYIFYAAWNPPFVILLWISTIIDWFAAKRLEVEDHRAKRLGLLSISVVANLGMLSFFKYGSFLLDNFVWVMKLFGIEYTPAHPDIVLPVGISFYTFQTMSYTLDVYRHRAHPAKSFLDFALYVTFFPQLVAGPIVRATQFIPQLVKPCRATFEQLSWGLFLMSIGLFQKVVLADGFLAPASEAVFGYRQGALHMLDAWLGVLAFSGQIFCDFAGYSTCAIGVALCFGFSLPDNFRFPYAAVGLSDFWRRWHISLSSWLRDYLYIGLGGNRKGESRTLINLMLTMLIGGLWHGASWTFVVWGGIHGIYLVVERSIKRTFGHVQWVHNWYAQVGLGLFTYFLVCITWVFFRATSFSRAWSLLGSMFSFSNAGTQILTTLDIVKVAIVTAGLLTAHWILRHKCLEDTVERVGWWALAVTWGAMVILIILMQGGGNAFIYFQF